MLLQALVRQLLVPQRQELDMLHKLDLPTQLVAAEALTATHQLVTAELRVTLAQQQELQQLLAELVPELLAPQQQELVTALNLALSTQQVVQAVLTVMLVKVELRVIPALQLVLRRLLAELAQQSLVLQQQGLDTMLKQVSLMPRVAAEVLVVQVVTLVLRVTLVPQRGLQQSSVEHVQLRVLVLVEQLTLLHLPDIRFINFYPQELWFALKQNLLLI